MRKTAIRATSAIIFSIIVGRIAFALPTLHWPSTSSPDSVKVNVDIGNSHEDYAPVVVRDPSDENYVVVWTMYSSGASDQDIRAQKISKTDGSPMWGSQDVLITDEYVYDQPEMNVFASKHIDLKSTLNGTFIAYDKSNDTESNIVLQKLNVNGTKAWGPNGLDITVDATPNTQWEAQPFIMPDSSGGAYLTWTAISTGFSSGTGYVAHITSAGVVDVGPVALTHGAYTYDITAGIVTDGAGGMIVIYLSTDFTDGDVLGLRLDSTLTPVMTWNGGAPSRANGVTMAWENTASANVPPNLPQVVSDENGGAIVTFIDENSSAFRIQKFDSTGARQWLFGRFRSDSPVITYYNNPTSAFVVSDGSGGAYTITTDSYNSNDGEKGVFGHHFNNTGNATGASIPLGDIDDFLEESIQNRMGTYIAFENNTVMAGFRHNNTTSKIQQMDTNGTILLGTDGLTFGSLHANGDHTSSPSITTNGAGGIVAVWDEWDNINWYGDIYAQYGKEAVLGSPPDAITDLAATAGNNQVTLNWTLPEDNGSTIESFMIEYDETGGGFTQTIGYSIDAACADTIPGTACTIQVFTPSVTNFTDYEFRLTMTNNNGTSVPSNEVNATPTSCSPLLYNDDSGGPTISTTCAALRINEGDLYFEKIPSSFSFPQKFSTQTSQHSFGSDNAGTSVVDVSTTDNNVLTVADLRNTNDGFDVVLTMNDFSNSNLDEISGENLYVATMYPENDDLTPIDPNLIGTEVAGIEFAEGSSNTVGASAPVHSDNARGTASNATLLQALVSAYTSDGSNFSTNPVILMHSTSARIARMSTDVLFYLNIPGNQPPGTYSVIFTIDLIPGDT